jgi:ammonium transporter, Amt family
MKLFFILFSSLILCFFSIQSYAATTELQQVTNNLDMAWLMTTGALVFFMQAGFALLESGMCRAKNTVNVIMKNYVDAGVGSIAFWFIGFGLMFGNNLTGWYGEGHWLLNIAEPHEFAFMFFQMMFATTCVTIASGAMAERTRYSSYLVGAFFICLVIYPVYGSWAWGSFYEGKGWLAQMGFIDFAGSSVVHSAGGWIALAGIMVLGPRMGRFSDTGKARTISGHNLTLVALGGFILWLGWFGFNGGSTTRAVPEIGLIILNTHLAASTGMVGSMLTMYLLRSPILMTETVNGSIAGLVGITAGCATMDPVFAAITGLIAGSIAVLGGRFLIRLRLDDVVGAVSVHAFAGVWGTLAAGMFFHGDLFDITRIVVQLVGIAACFLWVFPLAYLMYWVIDKVIGLRVSTIDEQRGLDYTEHFEIGYPEFQHVILNPGKE